MASVRGVSVMTEKKCGNCHWYHEDSRGIGIGTCLNMNSERMCSDNYFPCTHAKNYPCNHHVSETSTLEQRYQLLLEITRDLWQFIADRAPNMPQSVYILGKTAEQLEKLGVVVDD